MADVIPIRPTADKFWSDVQIGAPDECWHWTKFVHIHGYGQVHVAFPRLPGQARCRYATWKAHRLAWMLTNGPIPDGMNVDHTCHDAEVCTSGVSCHHRACCNPAHLEIKSGRENTLRSNGPIAIARRYERKLDTMGKAS